MIRAAAGAALLACTGLASAQVLVGEAGVTQAFNTIGANATVQLPNHWRVDRHDVEVRQVRTYSGATMGTMFAASTNMGSSALGGIYNFGTGSATSERAIGFLSTTGTARSGNLYGFFEAAADFSGLSISFDVEKYRRGANPAGFTIQLHHSNDGSNWTSAGNAFAVNFAPDDNNNGYSTAPGVVVSIVDQVLNWSLPAGTDFYLAWNYSVTSGTTTSNGQALAIDNITIKGLPADPIGLGMDLVWRPANLTPASYAWNTNGTNTNWQGDGMAVPFRNGDFVTFGNEGAGTVTIAGGGVTPGSILVNNDAGFDYAFVGGPINGNGGLTKSGWGTLALSNGNSYKGGTRILEGVVLLDNSTGAAIENETFLGDASGAVYMDDAVLRVTGTDGIVSPGGRQFHIGAYGAEISVENTSELGYVIQSAIHGAGPIFKTGEGVLRLGTPAAGVASASTFFGGLDVFQGAVKFANEADAGRTALRSNAVYIDVGAELSNTEELRMGEVSGGGRLAAVSAGGQGKDLVIHALGDGFFSGTLDMGVDEIRGALHLRGPGAQTFTAAPAGAPSAVTVSGAELVLGGNATLSGTPVRVTLHGGTLTLDNSEVNHADRMPNADAAAGAENAQVRGHGTLRFVGRHNGSAESLGSIALDDAGTIRVLVEHASATSPTVLNFAQLFQSGGGNINFVAQGGTLGAGGANPQLSIAGFEPNHAMAADNQTTLVNGIIGRKAPAGAGPDARGFAIVNGSDWATYDPANGVRALTTYTPFASSDATDNAILTGGQSLGETRTVNSLKIAPSSAGQTLNIGAGGQLLTLALLHAGNHDYSIGGAGGVLAVGAARHVSVGQGRTLSISAPINSDGGSPIVKSGDGLLVLAGTQGFTDLLQITGGVVRAEPGVSFPAEAKLALRGGIFEIAGPASETTLQLGLGMGAGQVSWASTADPVARGSGGFAAFGGPRKLDLGNAGPDSLHWEQPHFVADGMALVFGSATATGRIELVDHLSLDPMGGGNAYSLREIRVVDNPASFQDVAVLSGRLTSSPRNDLLKTGQGTLLISGDNANVVGLDGFNAGVIIGEGTLELAHDRALGDAPHIRMGLRRGYANTALLGHAGVTIGQEVHVTIGSGGIATLGAAPGFGPEAAGPVFTGPIYIASDADLSAPAGMTATFAGPVSIGAGVWVSKVGAGDVAITGPLSIGQYSILEVMEGRLEVGPIDADNVWVDAGATLALRDEGVLSTIQLLDIKRDSAEKWAGTVDITSNALLLRGADIVQVNGQVAQGLRDGRGIVSSLTGGIMTLTVMPVGADVLVKRALVGDFDDDGRVTAADYLRMDLAFLQGLSHPLYRDGDADYSGRIDGDDYFLVDQAYLNQPPWAGTPLSAAAPVPEPGSAFAVLLAGSLLALRRRRFGCNRIAREEKSPV